MKRDEVRINKLAALLKEQNIPDIDEIRAGAEKGATALQTTDIVSSVSSASTNTKCVGAKLFYDTLGDIETLLAAV